MLKIDLSLLRKKLPRNLDSLREQTKSMVTLVDTIIHSIRRISAELRPWVLDDLGLTAAIEWQILEFKGRTGIQCRFESIPEEITIDPDRSITLFRILQETLTNIIRHAHADEIYVRLEKLKEQIVLGVRDNGRGIRESQITDSKSLGLLGIRERVLLLGGTVQIQGSSRRGTTVTVRIPLIEEIRCSADKAMG